MKIFVQLLLLAIYIVIEWALIGKLKPIYAPWFSTFMSSMLILAYYFLSIRRLWIPLIVIFINTIIFPLFMLVAIGVPAYGSWFASANQLADSFVNHAVSWASFFVPVIGSYILAWVLVKRSNKSLHPTPKSGAAEL
jgi:hypothetical protein